MAKAKGKQVGLGNLAFNRIDPYGQAVAAAANPDLAEFRVLHLNSIRPDPAQPRQLLPTDLSEQFYQGDLPPTEVMRLWESQSQTAQATPSEQKNLAAIRQLADSIAQHGLINPITVQQTDNDKFLIVTGERRWWAHVWLTLHNQPIQEGIQEQLPDKIQVRLAPAGITIRAHQLIENLIREDINLLERAQGIVALRKEMENVARGQQKEAKVRWQDVEKALSMSRSYRIRTMKVLDLCPEAQTIIVKHDLTERAIRPIAEKLMNYPALQIQALEQLVAWQSEDGNNAQQIQATRQLVEQLIKAATQSNAAHTANKSSPSPERQAQLLQRKVKQTLRFVQQVEQLGEAEGKTLHHTLTQKAYTGLREDLYSLRQALDRLLDDKPNSNG